MSRQEFTEEEKIALLEKKYIVLEETRSREYASKIITQHDTEFQIFKHDAGFYLKTVPVIEDVTDEFVNDEQIQKSFDTFELLMEFIK